MFGDVVHVAIMQEALRELGASFAVFSALGRESLPFDQNRM
jgi:hypothetical protein